VPTSKFTEIGSIGGEVINGIDSRPISFDMQCGSIIASISVIEILKIFSLSAV